MNHRQSAGQPASNGPRSRMGDINRRFAVRTLLTAAFAAAIWYGAIRPIERSVAEDRSELDRKAAELLADAASEASLNDAKQRVERLRQRVVSLAAWTEKAGDRTNAYDTFRQLAAAAGVRLIRIEPKGQFILSPRRASTEAMGEVFGHGVHIAGGFRETAAFLDLLECELGSSRVLSFRVAPTRGPASVEASIDMSHIALNTAALRKLAAETTQPGSAVEDGR